jgi:hypothetical protein
MSGRISEIDGKIAFEAFDIQAATKEEKGCR